MRHRDFSFTWGRALWAAVMLAAFTVSGLPRQRVTHSNPVIHGDRPDPSVVRAGAGDFWATVTSAEWAPIFPLFHSRDLIKWRQVAAVFSRRPSWAANSFWAPEITKNRGRYYVYYTARKKDGPLCVAVATARRPSGPYADHGPLVCQEAGSIDATTVRDEARHLYLVWKEDGNSRGLPTIMWAQRLSDDGTRLFGEKTELIRNDAEWEAHVVEAPYIMRRGGWFYMFYSGNACCGRRCNYALGVARSRQLLGHWEKNPVNPILTSNEAWKCPGHGSVVSDARGHDLFLYHAYASRDSVFVGRQVLLDEISWDAGGWPSINDGRGPSGGVPPAFGAAGRKTREEFFDSFKASRLTQGWLWPHANPPSARIERGGGGWLTLRAAAGAGGSAEGLLAKLSLYSSYVATTVLRTPGPTSSTRAGLSAYGDGDNALGVTAGGGQITLWRRQGREQKVVVQKELPSSPLLYLRMTADGGNVRFAFSPEGRGWSELGEGTPWWDSNVNVALIVGGPPGSSAKFGWLRIKPLPTSGGR